MQSECSDGLFGAVKEFNAKKLETAPVALHAVKVQQTNAVQKPRGWRKGFRKQKSLSEKKTLRELCQSALRRMGRPDRELSTDPTILKLRRQLLLDSERLFIVTSPVQPAAGKNTVGMAGILPKKSINFTGGFHHV